MTSFRSESGIVFACFAACMLTASPVRADPCIVADDGSGTVTLPPEGCEYLSPADVHEIIDGLPAGTTLELAASHKDIICTGGIGKRCVGGINEGLACVGDEDCGDGTCRGELDICSFLLPDDCTESGGSLGGEKECAESTLELTLTGTGDLAGFSRLIMVPVQFETHTAPRTPGAPIQSFETDMFRLQGEIVGDPDFDLLRITAGTDFGLPSPGHTTLKQLPGGDWTVDSFFDIAYEIEFQGAPGGQLDGMAGITNGTLRMATPLSGVPTVSEWGLVALTLILLTAGTVAVLRRRSVRAVA